MSTGLAKYRFQNTTYRITVENPDHFSRGVILLEVDGVSTADKTVWLRDDAETHEVRVVLGTKSPLMGESKGLPLYPDSDWVFAVDAWQRVLLWSELIVNK